MDAPVFIIQSIRRALGDGIRVVVGYGPEHLTDYEDVPCLVTWSAYGIQVWTMDVSSKLTKRDRDAIAHWLSTSPDAIEAVREFFNAEGP